jgi:hypothetical protein
VVASPRAVLRVLAVVSESAAGWVVQFGPVEAALKIAVLAVHLGGGSARKGPSRSDPRMLATRTTL